jgi:hypothetical protein
MPDSKDEPRDGEEALSRAMDRLRAAVLFRRTNPKVDEWERINNRNNFARGIADSMRRKPA